jgi:allophanate hydrolase subunit 2
MIRVASVVGLALVQDGGRPGRMHEGVPPGGALDPDGLAAANAAAGNPPDAAAIEHYGPIELDDDGASRRFVPAGRVGYVAIAGGLEAPLVLGGRGALLGAGIGRPLRAGDTFPGHGLAAARLDRAEAPIRVVAGPDLPRLGPDALDVLCGAPFTISRVGDRAGIRLDGPAIDVRVVDGPSAPMVRGAIQVVPTGQTIVLGPDHPTTGGYPVVAVVARADFGRFAALRPGATVRFTRTEPGWSR